MKKLFNCAVLWLAFASMALAKSPKNIIIMIGDGMGINQIQAAYTQNGGHLNMTDRCPFVGLRRTNSANSYTTDSAAGGTAIATGTKTNNGMVGMTPDSVPLNSIIRLATLKGLSTGVRLLLYNYLNIRYIYMYISYINKNFRCYKNEINSKNVTIMSHS